MVPRVAFGLSSATARSIGQARRRDQPALSEDDRRAQRNRARRERARCKKTGKTEQQLLPSAQSSFHVDQPQYHCPSPFKGKTAHKSSEMTLLPHLPTFTVLPAHANKYNPRALAQSSRYIAAKSKAQERKNITPDDVQHIGDLDIISAQHRGESQAIAEEQDLNAAGILFKVANEQHPESTAMDTEIISVNTGGESDADLYIEYFRRCPVTTCEYHHKEFSLKTERDEHTRTHFEGHLTCGFWSCRYEGTAEPENPKFYFDNVKQLKSHVHKYHHRVLCLLGDFDCITCGRVFNDNEISYLEHLDDCIVRDVELQALDFA